MDGKKQMGSSSSSSFTYELFGPKESSGSSSSGIFGSIFAPSSRVSGRQSQHPEVVEEKQDSANQALNTKSGSQVFLDTIPRGNEGANQRAPNRDPNSPFYQEQRAQQPCHLSSSIYYGGQDIYSHPQTTQGSGYSAMGEKMIRAALREEIGGKGLYITKSSPLMACEPNILRKSYA